MSGGAADICHHFGPARQAEKLLIVARQSATLAALAVAWRGTRGSYHRAHKAQAAFYRA